MVILQKVIDPKFWTHKYVETNLGNVSVFWFKQDCAGCPLVLTHGMGSGRFIKSSYKVHLVRTLYKIVFVK